MITSRRVIGHTKYTTVEKILMHRRQSEQNNGGYRWIVVDISFNSFIQLESWVSSKVQTIVVIIHFRAWDIALFTVVLVEEDG